MSRRLLAAAVAVVLAALAAVLVITYVARADERAVAGMSPSTVLVVTEQVPEGTPAEDLADYLTVTEVPAATVVPGGVGSLAEVEGQITTTTLQPGEQLLAARFMPPEDVEQVGHVEVPEGFHQVTVQLEAQRVLGGHLAAGDTVGFFASADEPAQTHLVRHKVLVTRVEGGVVVVEDEDGTETTQGPSDSLLVTVAVAAPDAEIVVYAAEHHRIWLSIEPEDAPEDGTRVVDREELFG